MDHKVIRVLVVDDSAYVRKVVSQMLTRSPFIEVVGTARDGQHALELVAELRPDVVTLDLMMPVLDGIGFLRRQFAVEPIPVVVCSIANDSGELALRALDAGAVDFAQKPTALATEKVLEISAELIEKVKAAATVKLARLAPLPLPSEGVPTTTREGAGKVDIVVLGISTGGPQALRFLVPQFPLSFPVPIAIVMHMPLGYTEMYAANLDKESPLEVREAHEGDEVRAGLVLIAPAGRHLSFLRGTDGKVVTHLDARPLDTPHRPAVDVLFASAAEVYGSRVLGVVMTGMGKDGEAGAGAITKQGGRVFTQAEESCVVFGMPRAVVEAGLSKKCVHLDRMAQAIMEAV